jgi:proline dehydrogenase
MATQLDEKAVALPTRKIEISGIVADVTGNTLVLNVGSKDGLKVGDALDVSRPIKTVKDPTTGKVLRTITSKMGTATVTDVDAQSATANYSGSSPAKVGDAVKNAQ